MRRGRIFFPTNARSVPVLRNHPRELKRNDTVDSANEVKLIYEIDPKLTFGNIKKARKLLPDQLTEEGKHRKKKFNFKRLARLQWKLDLLKYFDFATLNYSSWEDPPDEHKVGLTTMFEALPENEGILKYRRILPK